MKRVSMYMGVMAAALAFSVVPGHAQNKDKDKNTADRTANMGGMGQDRVTREVRHELVMLPYYGVFDNLVYRVDGSTVRLYGQVTRPTLKNDAENVVKGNSFWASTANSMGNSRKTSLQKPCTIMETAS